jgi:glycosyltransferase involved in cell wall biosynthesis
MRIALVTETWRPSLDGVVTRLGCTVAELVRRGHAVLVVAPTSGPPLPGVVQERTRSAVFPLIDARRRWGLPDGRVPGLVQAFAPDVVHVVNPVLMGTWAVRRLAGHHPLVASLHTDLLAYAARYRLGAARPLIRKLNEAAYRQADLALATSPTGLGLLRELGVAEATIWPPGVDPEVFSTGAVVPVERAVDQPGRALDVVCVGRLAPEKGYDVLRPLVGPGPSAVPEIRLTFVGDGPDAGRLRRRFAGTPTTFLGRLHGRPLAQAYRAADVVAFTSATDTVGLVLLEAVALGRPVVAVDTLATRDTLGNYPRARLVPPDATAGQWRAALWSAATSDPTPEEVPRAGGPLSWAATTDVLLEAYTRVLTRGEAMVRSGT